MVCAVARITVDVNEEWLKAAQEVLGTTSKVATINAALHAFALRRRAVDLINALDSVEIDFEGSGHSWRYGGGRDLSRLEEDVRAVDVA
jgi:hypothetical protein